MKQWWSKLSPTQRKYAVICVLTVLMYLLIQFILVPIREAGVRTKRSIAAKEKVLSELLPLSSEYRLLAQKKETVNRILKQRPPNFTLFSYLEGKAAEAGLAGRIKSISPLGALVSGDFEEVTVNVRLEKVTLKQLTDFLYLSESRPNLILVRKMDVTKAKDDPEYLNAVLHVATYQMVR